MTPSQSSPKEKSRWGKQIVIPALGQSFVKLNPKTLAIMHGSSFTGDGAKALNNLDAALRDLFGPQK